MLYPEGHYYSPFPDLDKIRGKYDDSRFEYDISPLNLDASAQVALLRKLALCKSNELFKSEKDDRRLYTPDNPFFRFADAWVYATFMLAHRPKRIIEIGSGYSTALSIDINSIFLNNEIEIISIDPNPERLTRLIKGRDCKIQFHRINVEDVPLDFFSLLSENDILFIDSSHVLRPCGDVNFLLFNVLPRLANGVFIHFHDIFLFNYPQALIDQKIAWNEAYCLRAFLSYNDAFRIILLNKYMTRFFTEDIRRYFPELLIGHGGSSVWIQKSMPVALA
jgi:hypothetical protein